MKNDYVHTTWNNYNKSQLKFQQQQQVNYSNNLCFRWAGVAPVEVRAHLEKNENRRQQEQQDQSFGIQLCLSCVQETWIFHLEHPYRHGWLNNDSMCCCWNCVNDPWICLRILKILLYLDCLMSKIIYKYICIHLLLLLSIIIVI